ncbi:26274_t:CDS:2, partial [Dentiscutata erythropus]
MLLKLASLVNCTQQPLTYSLKYKLLNNTQKAFLSKRAGSIKLDTYLDLFPNIPVWAVVVGIGRDSKQGVSLIYDTESKDSFVKSSKCVSCPSFTYDPTRSLTYNKTRSTSNNLGRYHIYEYGTDFIENLTMPYEFGLVDSINNTMAIDQHVAGVFGLGYEKDDCNSANCNFYSYLKSKETKLYHSQQCAKNVSSCHEWQLNGGVIPFGDIQPTVKDIMWLPLIDQGGLWKININGITLLNTATQKSIEMMNLSQPAVISVTNPQMVFSVEFANAITNSVGGKYDPTYGYIGPCGSLAIIQTYTGELPRFRTAPALDSGYLYTIPIQDGSSNCYAGFTDTNV